MDPGRTGDGSRRAIWHLGEGGEIARLRDGREKYPEFGPGEFPGWGRAETPRTPRFRGAAR